jgi:hypothetical protein
MRSILIVLVLLFALSSWSQDQAGNDAPPATEDAPGGETPADDAGDDAASGEEAEDTDLDEQTYERDDDVFVPTEEIPVDEAIPFPTDI